MNTGMNLGGAGSGHQKLSHGLVLEHELTELRLLLERQAGVLLDSPHDELVAQLVKYMEKRRLGSFVDLMGRLQASEAECEMLLEHLLDKETEFFRHRDAFSAFERQAIPELYIRKSSQTSRSLRVWSARASSGRRGWRIVR